MVLTNDVVIPLQLNQQNSPTINKIVKLYSIPNKDFSRKIYTFYELKSRSDLYLSYETLHHLSKASVGNISFKPSLTRVFVQIVSLYTAH